MLTTTILVAVLTLAEAVNPEYFENMSDGASWTICILLVIDVVLDLVVLASKYKAR